MTGLLRFMGFTKRTADAYKAQWKTREPRGAVYLPKTLLVDDLKAVARWDTPKPQGRK